MSLFDYLPAELRDPNKYLEPVVPDFAVVTPRGSVTMTYCVNTDRITVTATERGQDPRKVSDFWGCGFHRVAAAMMSSARKPRAWPSLKLH